MREFGTVADVAEMSGKSTNSVIRYADAGKIECLTTDKGHRLFIDPKESAKQLIESMDKAMKKKVERIKETRENNKSWSEGIEAKLDEMNNKLIELLSLARNGNSADDAEQLDLFDESDDLLEGDISEEILQDKLQKGG